MPPPVRVLPSEYLRLVTWPHNQRQHYMRTVALSVEGYVDGTNQALWLPELFDLDTAVGEQLDFVGQWVGLTRFISVERRVFFTLNDSELGFDLGRWQTPWEAASELVRLDDEPYRHLLRARIVANNWDGTIPGAYAAWDVLWEGTLYEVLIQDGAARDQREFSLDDPVRGFDQALWRSPPPLADIYFTIDSAEPPHVLDTGFWYGPHTAQTVPGARVNGTMSILVALLGPPLDPLTKAIFSGGYMGLKSAAVGTGYMIQDQGTTGEGTGIDLPLFGFDTGPDDEGSWWLSADIDGVGLDQGRLFYPGAVPDPDWVPPGDEPPAYFAFDSAGSNAAHGFDDGTWFEPGWRPPVADPRPSTGVTYPPVTIAGFDLGAFGVMVG